MKLRNLALIPALGAVFMLGACDVDKTEEGDMPEVDVQGGNLPEYDVETADIEVTTDTQTIVTPDVDIEAPQ
jgi:hypothetical protein